MLCLCLDGQKWPAQPYNGTVSSKWSGTGSWNVVSTSGCARGMVGPVQSTWHSGHHNMCVCVWGGEKSSEYLWASCQHSIHDRRTSFQWNQPCVCVCACVCLCTSVHTSMHMACPADHSRVPLPFIITASRPIWFLSEVTDQILYCWFHASTSPCS